MKMTIANITGIQHIQFMQGRMRKSGLNFIVVLSLLTMPFAYQISVALAQSAQPGANNARVIAPAITPK